MIWRLIGPKQAEVSFTEAVEAGRVVRPKIVMLPTDWQYHLPSSDKWPIMLNALTRDPERNRLIAEKVMQTLEEMPGKSILILTDRIEHTEVLQALIPNYRTVVVHGELTRTETRERMDQVRAGVPVTIATTFKFGEGIDVPGWDIGFLATPMAGGGRTLQAVGRVLRAREGKEQALVIDFVDVLVTGTRVVKNHQGQVVGTKTYQPLVEAAEKRQKEYRRLAK